MLGCQNEKLEESEIYLQLLTALDEPIEVEVELSTNEEIMKILYLRLEAHLLKHQLLSRYHLTVS